MHKEFKVGDKVRILDGRRIATEMVSKVGTVIDDVDGLWNAEDGVSIEYDDGSSTWEWAENVEKVDGTFPNILSGMSVEFQRLSDTAKVPVKAHAGDAGFDLFADEDVTIKYGQTAIVATNIAIALPEGYVADIRPRSGLTSKTNIRVHYGTIDSNYRGNVGIIVENGAKAEYSKSVVIEKGDKIAQMVILPLPKVQMLEVDSLETTDRGTNGFGSTGVV